MKKNYWNRLAEEDGITRDELFLKLRDLYHAYMKHLYNDPKDVPDFRIHFSLVKRTPDEGIRKGYKIATVSRCSNEVIFTKVGDAAEIENFENSYTCYHAGYFIMVDFREDNISPLQFITEQFCRELLHQLTAYGIKRLKITYMFELLISSGVTEFFYGFYRLDINFIQNLCALTYERSYANSKLYIPRFDVARDRRTKKNGLDVAFSDPVLFVPDNLRQIRKLLELSDKSVALVIGSGNKVIGLTREEPYPAECQVRMWGHMSWTITYEGGKKISYYNARYHIHVQKTEYGLHREMQNLFRGLDEEKVLRLETVVRTAGRQRHGTILIIGSPEEIGQETHRICSMKSGTGIAGIDLSGDAEIISYLTSIDGAVIMDTDCTCACIGAILDGDAVTKGSLARGARFNSTLNYIKRKAELGKTFIGIVVSEDGTVDAVTKDRVIRLNLGN